MLRIPIDNDYLEQIRDVMEATAKEVDRAQTRALRKFQKQLQNDIKRQAAKEARLPVRALGGRFFNSKVASGQTTATVWVGTYPVSPFKVGTPEQSAEGVTSGNMFYQGAFLGKIYSGVEKVWIRLQSRYFSPLRYPTKKRPGDRGVLELQGRFPVVRAAIPIDGVLERIVSRNGSVYAKTFQDIFVRELNFATKLEGGAA